jgi:hypothetical protein
MRIDNVFKQCSPEILSILKKRRICKIPGEGGCCLFFEFLERSSGTALSGESHPFLRAQSGADELIKHVAES